MGAHRRMGASPSTLKFKMHVFSDGNKVLGWLHSLDAVLTVASLKEPPEERRRFIRDAGNLVRCLTIEFEIELSLGSTVVPVGKKFELAPSEVTTPLAMRPGPPSFSLAKTKMVSPLAMCLPPYIVFCALNANVSDDKSLTAALIANITLFSHH